MGQTIGEYYIAQGELKGELKGKREYVLMTLNWRFPDQVSPEAVAKVQNQEDPDVLSRWLRFAIQADSWTGFLALAEI